MRDKFIQQLHKWHDKCSHNKIIEAILEIPKAQRDYELIGLLGRAYNNYDEYHNAIETLLSVAVAGEDDALWTFRLAYAYYYLHDYERSLELFQKCKLLNPKEQDADMFINMSKTQLKNIKRKAQAKIKAAENNKLTDYLSVLKEDDEISIWFYIDSPKPLAISQKMNALGCNAYMNGYNWDVFFNFYLGKYAPDVLTGLDSAPEVGGYFASFSLTQENEKRAAKFAEIITHLVENEDEIYNIIRTDGSVIEWD